MEIGIFAPVLKELAKKIFGQLTKSAKASNKVLKINEKNIEESLDQHMAKVSRFSSEISFKELNKPKSLFAVYIPLDLSLERVNSTNKNSNFEKSASIVIEKVFTESENNVVLIGVPGAGKSTTLKYICQKLLTDEYFLGNEINIPILIRLREDEIMSNKNIPLFEYILNVFGISFENQFKCLDQNDDRAQLDVFKKKTVIKILNDHAPILILDGIDEVSDELIKVKLIKNINEISLSAKKTRFILTTRKGDDTFHIENTQVFELAPLSDNQIKQFINKWLGEIKSEDFFFQLSNSSVYDTAKRPLTLSHLCAIYEREGRIPEQSRSIYRKIVNLLILEWNLENQINRPSKFSNFEPDRKKEFLENMAFELSVFFNKNQFSTNDLEKCYRNLYMKFGLPIMQMQEVIKEIQVHNGLITQTGYDKYEFAHKSFQEYLAAEHIVRLPKLLKQYNLERIPSEMALAVTLSSEASEYLIYFIDEHLLKLECDFKFIRSFLMRIKIEKPEFSESLPLTISLFRLHSKYFFNALKLSMDGKTKQAIDLVNILDESFDSIMSFENIKFGIRSFNYQYSIYFERTNDLSFYKIVPINVDSKQALIDDPIYISSNFYKTYLSTLLEYPYAIYNT